MWCLIDTVLLNTQYMLWLRVFFSNYAILSKIIKCFWYSPQLSMKFQLLFEGKMVKNKYFFYLNSVVFIMLINFKLLTIVDRLTLMSQINFKLSSSMKKVL